VESDSSSYLEKQSNQSSQFSTIFEDKFVGYFLKTL